MDREFKLTDYRREGDRVVIAVDVSPTRFGGWMSVNEIITEHFSDPISAMDGSILGQGAPHVRGATSVGVSGDLSGIAALDFSRPSSPTQVRRALNRALKLRPKCKTMAIMDREIALAISHMSFPPVMEHTLGVAHILADRLSRADPATNPDLIMHPALSNASRFHPSVRNKAWYSALAKFRG